MAKKKDLLRLVTKDLTINRAAVNSISKTSILGKKRLENIAIKVIKEYKKAYRKEIKEGATKTEALEETLNNKKKMVQRVNNATVNEMAKDLKREYRGEYYEWIPSDANEPDPLHQLNYGKKFQLGVGEAPGDRYGCRCGMNILVKDTKLDF